MRVVSKVIVFLSLMLPGLAAAFDEFVLEDIKFKGLQRISLGTAFNYLPLKVGETLDEEKTSATIRALFKTGFFEDIWIEREGNILVIRVIERPSISSLNIFGNKDLPTEQLREAFKQIKLDEGEIFNRSLMDKMEQELLRQYSNLGKYGVKVETTVTELERNRVDIQLDIEEGESAQIRQIKIIGNKVFDEARLLDKMQLEMASSLDGDDYSKQQLAGDLETLKSYYMDRGYINFKIESTQVSISPDKQDVFITINVNEGDLYRLNEVSLLGEMVVPREELEALLTFEKGSVFSRKQIVETRNQLMERLGIDGYAFAKVNPIPEVNDENKTVDLKFIVDPGNRVYVRRINVHGNTKTRDEVIRRELRQMEGAWLSSPLLNRSKIRLQRLGFFEEVNVATPSVPGTVDQVDVEFEVKEGSTGSFSAGLGYGDQNGFLFNANVTLNNFLGTGKRVAVEINDSQTTDVYSFSYNNPYYTEDGVSRGFRVFSRTTDTEEASIARFNTDTQGAGINWGIPLTEYTSLRLGVGIDSTALTINETLSPTYYSNWVAEYGDDILVYNSTLGFSYDSRNRRIFPDYGLLSQVSAEVALPGGDLQYYKATFNNKLYLQLARATTLLLGAELSYGDGYGDTDELPFYENYFAGGTRSLRGFRGNTVGPRGGRLTDIEVDDGTGSGNTIVQQTITNVEPVGGNARFLGNIELFFPSPFQEEPSHNFRMSAFIDLAQVLGGEEIELVDASETLRSSYGIGAVWITPIGALSFSFARPITQVDTDETRVFGFRIGAPF